MGHCFLYDVPSYRAEYLNDVSFEEKVTAEGIYSTHHTKYGDLTSVQTYSPANFSYAHTKHMVNTAEELQIMAHIFENMRYVPDYERFHHYDKLIGEDGVLVEIAPINVTAVQKLLARCAGVGTTVELYYDETDIFDECVDRVQEAQMPAFDVLAGSGARRIEWPENLSSDVTGNFNIVFTSNKHPSHWRTNFNEDDALLCALDWIFDDATVFNIKGESFRGKKLETVALHHQPAPQRILCKRISTNSRLHPYLPTEACKKNRSKKLLRSSIDLWRWVRLSVLTHRLWGTEYHQVYGAVKCP